MKERSRLIRIIRLKERLRDVRRAGLAQAEGRARQALATEAHARGEVVELHNRLISSGESSALDLADRAAYLARARDRHEQAQHALVERQAERDQWAEAVADASREVRSLELLGDRLAKEERTAEARAEQREADEIAGRAGGMR